MELDYAHPSRVHSFRSLSVLACGLLATAGALLGMHYGQPHTNKDIMCTSFVIVPVGPIVIGLIAGIGYFIGSLAFGQRVHGWLLATIILLLMATYVGANFLSFKDQGPIFDPETGRPMGFLKFYDLKTVTMYRVYDYSGLNIPSASTHDEVAVGKSGYWYRAIGFVGLIFCGVGPVVSLRKRAYCEMCQIFMKPREMLRRPASARIPMGLTRNNLLNLNAPEHAEWIARANAVLDGIRESAAAQDAATLARRLQAGKEKVQSRTPLLAIVTLNICRRCHHGSVEGAVKAGPGYRSKLDRVIYSEHVSPDVVQQLIGASMRGET